MFQVVPDLELFSYMWQYLSSFCVYRLIWASVTSSRRFLSARGRKRRIFQGEVTERAQVQNWRRVTASFGDIGSSPKGVAANKAGLFPGGPWRGDQGGHVSAGGAEP